MISNFSNVKVSIELNVKVGKNWKESRNGLPRSQSFRDTYSFPDRVNKGYFPNKKGRLSLTPSNNGKEKEEKKKTAPKRSSSFVYNYRTADTHKDINDKNGGNNEQTYLPTPGETYLRARTLQRSNTISVPRPSSKPISDAYPLRFKDRNDFINHYKQKVESGYEEEEKDKDNGIGKFQDKIKKTVELRRRNSAPTFCSCKHRKKDGKNKIEKDRMDNVDKLSSESKQKNDKNNSKPKNSTTEVPLTNVPQNKETNHAKNGLDWINEGLKWIRNNLPMNEDEIKDKLNFSWFNDDNVNSDMMFKGGKIDVVINEQSSDESFFETTTENMNRNEQPEHNDSIIEDQQAKEIYQLSYIVGKEEKGRKKSSDKNENKESYDVIPKIITSNRKKENNSRVISQSTKMGTCSNGNKQNFQELSNQKILLNDPETQESQCQQITTMPKPKINQNYSEFLHDLHVTKNVAQNNEMTLDLEKDKIECEEMESFFQTAFQTDPTSQNENAGQNVSVERLKCIESRHINEIDNGHEEGGMDRRKNSLQVMNKLEEENEQKDIKCDSNRNIYQMSYITGRGKKKPGLMTKEKDIETSSPFSEERKLHSSDLNLQKEFNNLDDFIGQNSNKNIKSVDDRQINLQNNEKPEKLSKKTISDFDKSKNALTKDKLRSNPLFRADDDFFSKSRDIIQNMVVEMSDRHIEQELADLSLSSTNLDLSFDQDISFTEKTNPLYEMIQNNVFEDSYNHEEEVRHTSTYDGEITPYTNPYIRTMKTFNSKIPISKKGLSKIKPPRSTLKSQKDRKNLVGFKKKTLTDTILKSTEKQMKNKNIPKDIKKNTNISNNNLGMQSGNDFMTKENHRLKKMQILNEKKENFLINRNEILNSRKEELIETRKQLFFNEYIFSKEMNSSDWSNSSSISNAPNERRDDVFDTMKNNLHLKEQLNSFNQNAESLDYSAKSNKGNIDDIKNRNDLLWIEGEISTTSEREPRCIGGEILNVGESHHVNEKPLYTQEGNHDNDFNRNCEYTNYKPFLNQIPFLKQNIYATKIPFQFEEQSNDFDKNYSHDKYHYIKYQNDPEQLKSYDNSGLWDQLSHNTKGEIPYEFPRFVFNRFSEKPPLARDYRESLGNEDTMYTLQMASLKLNQWVNESMERDGLEQSSNPDSQTSLELESSAQQSDQNYTLKTRKRIVKFHHDDNEEIDYYPPLNTKDIKNITKTMKEDNDENEDEYNLTGSDTSNSSPAERISLSNEEETTNEFSFTTNEFSFPTNDIEFDKEAMSFDVTQEMVFSSSSLSEIDEASENDTSNEELKLTEDENNELESKKSGLEFEKQNFGFLPGIEMKSVPSFLLHDDHDIPPINHSNALIKYYKSAGAIFAEMVFNFFTFLQCFWHNNTKWSKKNMYEKEIPRNIIESSSNSILSAKQELFSGAIINHFNSFCLPFTETEIINLFLLYYHQYQSSKYFKTNYNRRIQLVSSPHFPVSSPHAIANDNRCKESDLWSLLLSIPYNFPNFNKNLTKDMEIEVNNDTSQKALIYLKDERRWIQELYSEIYDSIQTLQSHNNINFQTLQPIESLRERERHVEIGKLFTANEEIFFKDGSTNQIASVPSILPIITTIEKLDELTRNIDILLDQSNTNNIDWSTLNNMSNDSLTMYHSSCIPNDISTPTRLGRLAKLFEYINQVRLMIKSRTIFRNNDQENNNTNEPVTDDSSQYNDIINAVIEYDSKMGESISSPMATDGVIFWSDDYETVRCNFNECEPAVKIGIKKRHSTSSERRESNGGSDIDTDCKQVQSQEKHQCGVM